jgi:hypothetical protein
MPHISAAVRRRNGHVTPVAAGGAISLPLNLEIENINLSRPEDVNIVIEITLWRKFNCV